MSHTTDSKTTDDRRRWLALYVLCTGMLMIVLDGTVVNVALPTIKDDLGFTQSNLAWVINAYMIAFGGLLLLAGRVGDLIGQRKLFMIGLTGFTGASLLCAASPTQEVLIGARFLQGVGGALTSAVILGMIVTMFPEPREQAKAIGVFGFVASAGGSIGLLLGGVLTDLISWHWIFLINLPIGIGVGVMALRLVDAKPGIGLDKGADTPGAVLITASLMLGVFTVLGIEEHGWVSARTLILAAVSGVLLAAFIQRQRTIDNPLMPPRLFHSRNVVGANIIQALVVVGMFGIFFLGALYLGGILDYSPLGVGFAFLPSCVVMGYMSLRVSNRLIMRFGPRRTLIPSLVAMVLGLLWLARSPVDANYWIDVFPVMVLLGLGAGLAFPALMMLAMSGATPEDSGLASGLVNTSVQVGGAIGLAVLATVAGSRTEAVRGPGVTGDAALNSGYHLAYLIGAALVLSGIALAIGMLKDPEMPAGGHEMAGDPATIGADAGEREPAFSGA